MADGVDVPIKLPTDTSGPKAGAAAVKGLLDSLNAMGEAGAKGGKKAQQAVIGVATAAAKAQVAVEKTAAQEAAKAATAQAKAAAKAKNDAALSAQKHAQRVDAENQKSFLAHQSAAQKHAHDIHKKRVDQEIAEEKRAAKEASKAHREAAKATAKEQKKIKADAQKAMVAQKSEFDAAGARAIAGAMAAITAAVVALSARFMQAVVAAQAFKEATLGAFSKLLGGANAANKALLDTIKTADDIGGGYKETLSAVNSLLAKGFKADQAQLLVKAMADLKSVSPSANIQGLLAAIGQIKGKGILQMEELQQQIAEHGLATSVVLEEIGKKIGKSSAEVRKMISAGKISADQGIQGILAAIQKTTGKPIGEAAKEAANSLGGLIARLGQVPEGLLMMADASQGMGVIKDVLKNVLAAFAPSTEGGKALSKAIGELADAFGAFFSGLTGKGGAAALQDFAKGAAAFISDLAGGIKLIGSVVGPILGGLISGFGKGMSAGNAMGGAGKKAGVDFVKLGEALGKVAGAVGYVAGLFFNLIFGIVSIAASVNEAASGIMGFFSRVYGAITSAATTVLTAATSIGSNLILGIISGITGGMPGLLGAIAQVASTTTSAAQGGYQIKSPSKLWERKIGYQLKAGEAKGIVKGQGLVNSALDRTAGQSMANAGGAPTSAQGGGGRTIGQIGPFYITAKSERDAEGIWRVIDSRIRAYMTELGFTPAFGGA
jgi:tape measure domain-containing protein